MVFRVCIRRLQLLNPLTFNYFKEGTTLVPTMLYSCFCIVYIKKHKSNLISFQEKKVHEKSPALSRLKLTVHRLL